MAVALAGIHDSGGPYTVVANCTQGAAAGRAPTTAGLRRQPGACRGDRPGQCHWRWGQVQAHRAAGCSEGAGEGGGMARENTECARAVPQLRGVRRQSGGEWHSGTTCGRLRLRTHKRGSAQVAAMQPARPGAGCAGGLGRCCGHDTCIAVQRRRRNLHTPGRRAAPRSSRHRACQSPRVGQGVSVCAGAAPRQRLQPRPGTTPPPAAARRPGVCGGAGGSARAAWGPPSDAKVLAVNGRELRQSRGGQAGGRGRGRQVV